MSIASDINERSLAEMLAHYDQGELTEAMAFFAYDTTVVFGNGEPIDGRDAAQGAFEAFGKMVRAVSHEVTRTFGSDRDAAVEALVTYTTLAGEEVMIPSVEIAHYNEDGLIDDFRIYIDLAPLQA